MKVKIVGKDVRPQFSGKEGIYIGKIPMKYGEEIVVIKFPDLPEDEQIVQFCKSEVEFIDESKKESQ